MNTDHEKSAVDEHKHAAEQIDRAKALVGEALGEIDDISRGMKISIHDGKKLPSKREMRKASNATDLSPAERHFDRSSSFRSV